MAEPITEYALTTSVSGGNGTIDPPSGMFAENSVVDLTATPDPNYAVAAWSGTDDDGLTTAANTVTMTGDRTVAVSFQLVQRQLTASVAGGQGAVSPESGSLRSWRCCGFNGHPGDRLSSGRLERHGR